MSTRAGSSAASQPQERQFCVLVTGAASGLGYAIAKHYEAVLATGVEGHNTKLYCVDRHFPWTARPGKEPRDSLNDHAGCDVVREVLDITNESALRSLGRKLDANNDIVHLVVHCAGIRGLSPSVRLENNSDVRRAETLETMDAPTVMSAMSVNAVGTFSLLQALTPSLRRGSTEKRRSRAVVLGSRMGSISLNTNDNPSGGAGYAYRASKAAQNAIVRSLSVDVQDVIWTTIHPGRVETGLVAIKEEGAKSIDEVLPTLMKLIDTLTLRDSGRFIDIHGEDIPW